MKNVIVLLLILVAIFIAAFIQTHKKDNSVLDRNVDVIANALNGIGSILPEKTNIAFRWNGDGFDLAVYLWTRDLLAPRYCILEDQKKQPYGADTVLSMCKAATPDSMLRIYTNNRKVIWSNRDSAYSYLLTCSH